LKSLGIDYVHFPNHDDYCLSEDIVINMHSLVSLHIGALLCGGMPSLVDVRSLETASIYLNNSTFSEACTILGALSNVKKLGVSASIWCGMLYMELRHLQLTPFLCLFCSSSKLLLIIFLVNGLFLLSLQY
jgi:hypothetical protein